MSTSSWSAEEASPPRPSSRRWTSSTPQWPVSRGAGVDADGVHFLANCFTLDDRIAEAAQEWDADIIVFGSRRRRLLPRLGGRGLRERVTALTGLPTLVAPAPLRLGRRIARRELDPAALQPLEELIVS